MKILASSDFHGRLPNIAEPFDLFLICGDVCPVECHGINFQEDWLQNDFIEWVNRLPFKTSWSKVVMTWGNHDFYGEKCSEEDMLMLERLTNFRLKILRHSSYDFEYPVNDGIDTLKIFGTPYCGIFGRWAFMKDDDTLNELFSEIKEDTDVIVSHDSPNRNGLGDITQGKWARKGTGNNVLYDHILRVNPKLFVCGHFHSGNHEFKNIDGIYMANVSYIDENYEPFWPVLSIDYDEENRIIIEKKEDKDGEEPDTRS